MTSAKIDMTCGTSCVKTADWYMMDSREDEHMMLPPKDSSLDSISSAEAFVVL
jgi:hypothetical protein